MNTTTSKVALTMALKYAVAAEKHMESRNAIRSLLIKKEAAKFIQKGKLVHTFKYLKLYYANYIIGRLGFILKNSKLIFSKSFYFVFI